MLRHWVVLFWSQHSTEAEVAEANCAVGHQQNVGGLDVPVDDRRSTQVGEGLEEAGGNFRNLSLSQYPAFGHLVHGCQQGYGRLIFKYEVEIDTAFLYS